jgi:hypothetical protein
VAQRFGVVAVSKPKIKIKPAPVLSRAELATRLTVTRAECAGLLRRDVQSIDRLISDKLLMASRLPGHRAVMIRAPSIEAMLDANPAVQ